MSRAVMQQALEALECTAEAGDPGHRCGHCDDYVDRNGVVRAALREALAQPDDVPEGCTPADAMVLREANHALAIELHAAQAALARQGEPVAWLWEHPTADYGLPERQVHFHGDSSLRDGWTVTPLYAAPQPAPVAQPLTDELIQKIAEDYANSFVHVGTRFDEFDARGFARAIERAVLGGKK